MRTVNEKISNKVRNQIDDVVSSLPISIHSLIFSISSCVGIQSLIPIVKPCPIIHLFNIRWLLSRKSLTEFAPNES